MQQLQLSSTAIAYGSSCPECGSGTPSVRAAPSSQQQTQAPPLPPSLAPPQPSGGALPAELVRARQLKQAGLRASGVMLALAAATATATATKAVLADKVQLEVHKGRVYVQWGAPMSGPPVSPTAIEVRPTGDVRGNGAFAVEPIPAGTYLGDYEGEMLDEAAYWQRYPSGVSDYCMRLDQEWTIDGRERAQDTAAFSPCHLNHSASRMNVVRQTSRRERRVSFYTMRDLQAGEELLLDYGRTYWTGREALELE
ncbi:hypothetical protein WJX72_004345 [[Myrmecia] bisecta]|uniref:SET domain-containing protein n=1 Tax=[Myrmecia] bisecta TaxID=41462 RepID=A0AAW1QQ14_9CHLO